jgi:copper chaperone CopZ
MREKLSAAGAVVVAVLASSCCWAPLLLAGLGAGGAGFASTLGPYRPYLMGLTFAFLAGAWYFTLRKRPAEVAVAAAGSTETGDTCCVKETCCAPAAGRRRNILLLSGVTAFALAMLAFPQISGVLAGSGSSTSALDAAAGPVESATLAIQGMTCEACEGHLRDVLLEVPGVVAAEADYRTGSAQVRLQQGRVSTDQLKQAVAKTGYRVTSVTRHSAALPDASQPLTAAATGLKTVLLGIEGMT